MFTAYYLFPVPVLKFFLFIYIIIYFKSMALRAKEAVNEMINFDANMTVPK